MDCQRCGYPIAPTDSHEQSGAGSERQHQISRCFDLIMGDRNVARTAFAEAIAKIEELTGKLAELNDPDLPGKLAAAIKRIEELEAGAEQSMKPQTDGAPEVNVELPGSGAPIGPDSPQP